MYVEEKAECWIKSTGLVLLLGGLLQHLYVHARDDDASVVGHAGGEPQFWIAGRRMRFMVLEAVEIFVAFAADVAFVWLFLFHALSTWVWFESDGVDDSESSIDILLKSLSHMTVLWHKISMVPRPAVERPVLPTCDISNRSDSCRLSRSQ